MKKKSLKKFTLRRYKPYKDSEGNNIEEYESKRYDDEKYKRFKHIEIERL